MQNTEVNSNSSWWHTLPGLLTGVATVITAVTGLIVVISNIDDTSADNKSVPNISTEVLPSVISEQLIAENPIAASVVEKEIQSHSKIYDPCISLPVDDQPIKCLEE